MISHIFSLSCTPRAAMALLALLLMAAPAMAAEKPASVKGAWAVNMIQNEKKEFNYCLARAPYDNDLQLAIALSPKRELNIGVAVPGAGFGVGDKYPMVVSIDGKFKRQNVGLAAQPELLMMPFGPDKDVVPALKGGKVLSIEGPQDVATFNLKGSGKALTDLQQCVDVGTGKIKPPTPEQQAAAAAKAAKGKGGKGAKFPPSLLQMLKDAGLKDLEIVDVPDPSKAPVDFAWHTEGVLGGLRERPVPADVTLEKMSGIIEDGYKKQCSGTFKADFSAPEQVPGVTMRTADISCSKDDKSAQVSLLIYLTDTHLFSMFMHEAAGADKSKAVSARDKIANAIRTLAKQQKPSAAPAAESVPAPGPRVEQPAAATTSSNPWAAPDAAPAAAPAAPAPAAAPATPPAAPTPAPEKK